jgi:hypothetical protein
MGICTSRFAEKWSQGCRLEAMSALAMLCFLSAPSLGLEYISTSNIVPLPYPFLHFSNIRKMAPVRVYKSPFAAPFIPTDVSISQFLNRHNPDDVPLDKPILSDFDTPGNSITFGGLREKAALCAAGLRSVLALSEGDVVSIFGQNSVNWMVLAHSVMWSGACFRCVLSIF